MFINAASSGVGVAALQLAKLLGARPVIGSSGVAAKLEALAAWGMDVGINYQTESVGDALLAATQGEGVDVIIDHVGASHLADHLRGMALKGASGERGSPGRRQA